MNDMNAESHLKTTGELQKLPDWAECDLFCIQDYADTVHSRCGWRGRLQEAIYDATKTGLLCPRCGCATLFRISPDRAETP